jgi:hypothetical protein
VFGTTLPTRQARQPGCCDAVSAASREFPVQKAAVSAGFHRRIAAQFVGVLEEMVSNVYEHSRVPGSGMVAFRAGGDRFEFVVADGGIGVLERLRTFADYSCLTDHGDALRLALTDGVSRFGPDAQRGTVSDLFSSVLRISPPHCISALALQAVENRTPPWKQIRNVSQELARAKFGAGDGNRTHDIQLGKLTFYL